MHEQVSFMSKCKNNCDSHSGVNKKKLILIRISILIGFNKTRKDRKIIEYEEKANGLF